MSDKWPTGCRHVSEILPSVLSRCLGAAAANNIMKTIKSDEQSLKDAAQMIKDGNAMFGVAKKKTEAGKEIVSRWLKDNRGIDLETLPIGEILNLDGVVLIEIGKQTRFDEARFAQERAEDHAAYMRDNPVRKFKPLV
jgi:hypothetical protein